MQALSGLPDTLRDAAGKHYEQPLKSKDDLTLAVNRYTEVIADAARSRGDLDVHLAHCIAESCLALLEHEWDSRSEHEQRLIQCACAYFVDDEDEDGDLQSVFGFDDDAELVNAVVHRLGRPDLAIPV